MSDVFYTDKQLRERWHCSHMKLWRLRRDKKLNRSRSVVAAAISRPSRKSRRWRKPTRDASKATTLNSGRSLGLEDLK